VSHEDRITARSQVEGVILSQTVFYHLARFAIVNDFLINKNPLMSVQPRAKWQLPTSGDTIFMGHLVYICVCVLKIKTHSKCEDILSKYKQKSHVPVSFILL